MPAHAGSGTHGDGTGAAEASKEGAKDAQVYSCLSVTSVKNALQPKPKHHHSLTWTKSLSGTGKQHRLSRGHSESQQLLRSHQV